MAFASKLFSLLMLACLVVNYGAATFLLNLQCKPRETVIETSKDFKYFPYYVHLHRCAGSERKKPPVFFQCVPSKEEKVYVLASLSSDVSRARRAGVELELMNHTSCKTECLIREEDCKAPAIYDKKSCRCICNTGIARPSAMLCKDPRKIWNGQLCGCSCANMKPCKNRRMRFDQETCSCKCKERKQAKAKCIAEGGTFDLHSCGCIKLAKVKQEGKEIPLNSKSTLFWISIAVAEFFVMACVFDAFLYSKNSGLIFTAKQRIIRPKEKKYEKETQDQLTYQDLRRRQSRLSSALRKRSSRTSTVHPVPQTPNPISPTYEFKEEDVFFAQ